MRKNREGGNGGEILRIRIWRKAVEMFYGVLNICACKAERMTWECWNLQGKEEKGRRREWKEGEEVGNGETRLMSPEV